jgi:hypothetical protein
MLTRLLGKIACIFGQMNSCFTTLTSLHDESGWREIPQSSVGFLAYRFNFYPWSIDDEHRFSHQQHHVVLIGEIGNSSLHRKYYL